MPAIRVAGIVFVLVAFSWADERAAIRWHSQLDEAWRRCQEERRPMLVFVSRPGCPPCQRMKGESYVDREVRSLVAQNFVPLALDGKDSSPLMAELGVRAFPATFVISPEAVVIDRMDGYLPPATLASRLSAASRWQATGVKTAGAAPSPR